MWMGVFLLYLAVGPACSTLLADELDAMRAKYEQAQQVLTESAESRADRVISAYKEELEEGATKATADGNLEVAIAFREELERVNVDPIIPAAHPGTIKSLRTLQEAYRPSLDEAVVPISRKIVTLNKHYLRSLSRLRKKRRSANDTAGAARVKAESARILDSDALKIAMATVKRMDAPKKKKTTPKPKPKPAQQQPEEQPVQHIASAPVTAIPKAAFYAPGKEPRQRTWKLTLYHTSQASRAILSNVRAEVVIFEDDSGVVRQKSSNKYYTHRSESGKVMYVPRITLAAQGSGGLKDSTMVIEYMSRDKNTKKAIARDRTEHVKFPKMPSGKRIVVDGGGVGLDTQSTKYSGYIYATGKHEYGREIFGFIISVFDGNGSMIYQRCTQRSLKNYVRDGIPPEQYGPKALR